MMRPSEMMKWASANSQTMRFYVSPTAARSRTSKNELHTNNKAVARRQAKYEK